MPHAICSNSSCNFSVKLHNIEAGMSIETPKECPCCASAMISICSECGFLLTGNPAVTLCSLCQADLKAVFAVKRVAALPEQGFVNYPEGLE
jgi:hypothetical protein